jgi:hypothetical protein
MQLCIISFFIFRSISLYKCMDNPFFSSPYLYILFSLFHIAQLSQKILRKRSYHLCGKWCNVYGNWDLIEFVLYRLEECNVLSPSLKLMDSNGSGVEQILRQYKPETIYKSNSPKSCLQKEITWSTKNTLPIQFHVSTTTKKRQENNVVSLILFLWICNACHGWDWSNDGCAS